MKRIAWLLRLLPLLLLSALPAHAQFPNAQGWCEDGAQNVITSGLTSTTLVQASYPQCTVSVSVHGGGIATIYSNDSGTPLSNPFTAQANGQWQFFAAVGSYDIALSGAGFSTTVVYSEVSLGTGGGGGGSGTVTVVNCSGLSPLYTCSVTNPTTTPTIVPSLSTAPPLTIFGNCTAGTLLPSYCAINTSMLPNYLSGSIASPQIAFGSGANTIAGDAQFIWNSTTHTGAVGTTLPPAPPVYLIPPLSDIGWSVQMTETFDSMTGSQTVPMVVAGYAPDGGTAPASTGILSSAYSTGVNIAYGLSGTAISGPGMGQTVPFSPGFPPSVCGGCNAVEHSGIGTINAAAGSTSLCVSITTGTYVQCAAYWAAPAENDMSAPWTNNYGYYAAAQTVGTNNYNYYSETMPNSANTWQYYAAGTTGQSLFPNVQLLTLQFNGSTSGSKTLMAAAIASTSQPLCWPTTDATTGQVMTATVSAAGCAAGAGTQLGWSANGAATWAGLTAGTNSNAGSFIASGNTWNFTAAAHTLPTVTAATSGALPASCTTGELGFVTGSTAGQNIWECNGGVWTQQLNSGTGSASTSLGNLAAVAINTTLLPAAVNTVALGSTSLPFTNLFLGPSATNYFSFAGLGSLTAARTLFVPNAASTAVQACGPTTNNFVTAISVTTGACTLAQPAIANLSDGATIVTASSTTTLTNKTLNAESTGNNLSEPIKAYFAAAGCNASTPGPAIDLGPTNTPTLTCGGSTVTKAYLGFARGNVAYINWHLPPDWNSSAATDIEFGIITTDTTNGHVISYNVQTGCNAVNGTATDDPALNTLQAASYTIVGATQISGGAVNFSKTALTMTGCTADSDFEIALTRNNSGTDTATNTAAAVQLKFVEMTIGVTKNAANR